MLCPVSSHRNLIAQQEWPLTTQTIVGSSFLFYSLSKILLSNRKIYQTHNFNDLITYFMVFKFHVLTGVLVTTKYDIPWLREESVEKIASIICVICLALPVNSGFKDGDHNLCNMMLFLRAFQCPFSIIFLTDILKIEVHLQLHVIPSIPNLFFCITLHFPITDYLTHCLFSAVTFVISSH